MSVLIGIIPFQGLLLGSAIMELHQLLYTPCWITQWVCRLILFQEDQPIGCTHQETNNGVYIQ